MALQIKVPGSGGELIQGSLNGAPFLVTCPIDWFAAAVVTEEPGCRIGCKAQQALRRTLAYLQAPALPRGLRLVSTLPQGKGMASSSADIAAVCQAAAMQFGRRLTEAEIAAIAVSIEPTDAVFCAGIVRVNHLSGEVLEVWHKFPALRIAIFDLGGCVDTLRFNRRPDLGALNEAKEPAVREALRLLRRGFADGDARAVGQAATISAFANQTLLPKPQLARIYETARGAGAVGVTIAHSGTVVGLMFAADAAVDFNSCVAAVRRRCPEIAYLRNVRLISGGVIIEESDGHDGTI